jgi:hypothetical protein
MIITNINLDILSYIIIIRGKVEKWPLIAFKDRGPEREGTYTQGKGQVGAG